jgi:spoIIIJ-associated protein
MDWVETTGKTVEEATKRALQHLGVGTGDAEVEVLEEPKAGMFGRVKGEARVRARVRPHSPRPKRGTGQGRARNERGRGRNDRAPKGQGDKPRQPRNEAKPKNDDKVSNKSQNKSPKEDAVTTSIPLADQAAIAKEFLEGLLKSLDLTASVNVKEIDSETVELAIDHEPATELGVLVGPRGTTLQALQEITRTVVQAKSQGKTDRILVDVARYRKRRVAALARFGQKVAQEVIETGEERALEPMSPADRKAIHDGLTGIDGIVTRSEGEEPRRFVVIAPA